MSTTVLLWLLIALIAFVIEIATVSLVSVWFMAGALVAALLAGLHQPFFLQLLAFMLISWRMSAWCFRTVKPLLEGREYRKTNSDRLIGQEAIVLEEIDPFTGGRVKAGGMDWMAITSEEEPIPVGNRVQILDISGVKLHVAPIRKEENYE